MENNVLSAVIPGIDLWFHYQTSQIIVLGLENYIPTKKIAAMCSNPPGLCYKHRT